jgi:hypothetical protein
MAEVGVQVMVLVVVCILGVEKRGKALVGRALHLKQ